MDSSLRFQLDYNGYSIVKDLPNVEESPYCASAFRWACTWIGHELRREEPLFIPVISIAITFITTPFSRKQKERMNKKLGKPCACPASIKSYHENGDELSHYVEPPGSSPLSSVTEAVWRLIISFLELEMVPPLPLLYQRFQASFIQRVNTNTARAMKAFLGWMNDKGAVHLPLYVLSQLFRFSSAIRRSFLTKPALKDVIFEILEEELEQRPNELSRIGVLVMAALTELGQYSNLDKYSFFLFQNGPHPSAVSNCYMLVGKLLELSDDSGFENCDGLANLAKICHAQMDLEYSPYQAVINKYTDAELFQVQTELQLADATVYDLLSLYVQYSEKFGSMCHHVAGHTQHHVLREVKVCARCRVTRYCSQMCQKEDWEKHKVVCRMLKEGKELSRAEPPEEEEKGCDEWYRAVDKWEEGICAEVFEQIFFYTTPIRAQISYKC